MLQEVGEKWRAIQLVSFLFSSLYEVSSRSTCFAWYSDFSHFASAEMRENIFSYVDCKFCFREFIQKLWYLSFRLTPSVMFVILFYTKLTPFLAYSPIWTLQKDNLCPKYWWTNLLYINNFYPTSFTQEVMDSGQSVIINITIVIQFYY
jgi:hypothetical protein